MPGIPTVTKLRTELMYKTNDVIFSYQNMWSCIRGKSFSVRIDYFCATQAQVQNAIKFFENQGIVKLAAACGLAMQPLSYNQGCGWSRSLKFGFQFHRRRLWGKRVLPTPR